MIIRSFFSKSHRIVMARFYNKTISGETESIETGLSEDNQTRLAQKHSVIFDRKAQSRLSLGHDYFQL